MKMQTTDAATGETVIVDMTPEQEAEHLASLPPPDQVADPLQARLDAIEAVMKDKLGVKQDDLDAAVAVAMAADVVEAKP